jgi:hypothetical protein
VKLKVNLISGGRYYKAGEDIPEDALPDFASRYASEGEDGDAVDASYAETLQQQRSDLDDTTKPKVVKASGREGKMKGKSYVKREDRFILASSVETLLPGETLYWHRPRSFGVDEKWIAYSKVRASEADSL